MGSEIARHEGGALSMVASVNEKAILDQVAMIQKVMVAVMKDGTHYGTIPGTNQPTLYKSGSEALLSAFKISVEPEVSESRTPDGHIAYTVKCIGRHMTSGIVVGVGIGECSTAEEKYQWRGAVCQEEYDEMPETHKRKKWLKGRWEGGQQGPARAILQVRTNPADLANTVLKMAKKRAQIDLTLTALSASDIFTQDLEDLPEEYRDGMTSGDKPKGQEKNKYQPRQRNDQAVQQASGDATEPQIKMIKARLSAAGKAEADLCTHFKVESVEAIGKSNVNAALDWIQGKGQ